MADSPENKDPGPESKDQNTTTEPREPASETRREERREERRETTTAAQEKPPELVECPDCDALMYPTKLGSHRWRAHAVDRRTAKQQAAQEKDKPTRERKPPPGKSQENGDADKDKQEPRKSRWSEVRESW
jgi:hypothetical protein